MLRKRMITVLIKFSICLLVYTKIWPCQIILSDTAFLFAKNRKFKEKFMYKKYVKILWIIGYCIFVLSGCSGTKKEIGKVTLSIRCDTAIANDLHKQEKWSGILPEDGCMLSETEITLYEGDTVLDVLLTVRDQYNIHMEYNGTQGMEYIEGIGNLYEYDGGRWSGWMFCINGKYQEMGCGQYVLSDGDIVEWNYTCDLGLDLDSELTDAKKWKETHE